MAVYSIKNQYPGINAHLRSLWQGIGRWNRFHNVYITQLMQSLKSVLRPMGYTADIEESLQIRRLSDTDEDTEHPYFAVVIYEQFANFKRGEAVAWIELLSPANKGRSRDAETYPGKRRLLVEKGLVFVEIDYLHETPPTFPRLANYTGKQPGSHPYRIVVLDPHPDFKTGAADVHEFDVEAPIPTVPIPLNAGDVLQFDFGMPYQKVFEESFYGDDVDYAELPLNFDRYSDSDKLRIMNRKLTVIEAADLEKAPLPLTKNFTSMTEALDLLNKVTGRDFHQK